MITVAPILSILLVSITAVLTWLTVHHHYKGIINTLRANIDLHRDRADSVVSLPQGPQGGSGGSAHAPNGLAIGGDGGMGSGEAASPMHKLKLLGLPTDNFDRDAIIKWLISEFVMLGSPGDQDQWINSKLCGLGIPWIYKSNPSGYKLEIITISDSR